MKKLLSLVVIAAASLLNSMSSAETFLNESETAVPIAANTEPREVTQNDANVYTVEEGDSVTNIAVKYGVPVEELVSENDLEGESLEQGDKLIIPESVTAEEKELLAKLVHAEARGESYEGKVAVATVVLNRVDSSQFPDTITEVIYEKNQFSPVSDGSINLEPSEEAIEAANEAIALQEEGTDATFFYNPDATNDQWIRTLPVIEIIGNHYFATS